MPPTEVQVFRSANGDIRFQNWLQDVEQREQKAYAKCLAYILASAEHGNGLRRPMADFLRDGIYELRPSLRGTHYRILYFFSGHNVAVLSHGITKVSTVPSKEIELAIERMALVERDHGLYTAEW